LRGGDCSYLSSEHFGITTAFRTFFRGSIDPVDPNNPSRFWAQGAEHPIQKGNEVMNTPITNLDDHSLWRIGFGSPHPGTCNFLLGDGSVRGISVTTPVNPMLLTFALADSGKAATLP
jgi:prepilin-type processing-associated H-X9-DG protein